MCCRTGGGRIVPDYTALNEYLLILSARILDSKVVAGITELGGGARCSRDFPFTLCKRCLDAFSLECSVIERRGTCGRLRFVYNPALINRKFVSVTDDQRAFDHVLQFANIARPRILLQGFKSIFLDVFYLLSSSLCIMINEVIYQQWDVFSPFTQRRQRIGKTLSR